MSNKEISILYKQAEDEFYQFIYNQVAPNMKPTPLKPLKFLEAEIDKKIKKIIDTNKEENIKGLELYFKAADETEKVQLQKICQKIAAPLLEAAKISNPDDQTQIEPLDLQDFILLEDIANRVLATKAFADASCMFRLMLGIHPLYGAAWRGWAQAELDAGNIADVEKICEIALTLLPHDYFVCTFSARFYLKQGDKTKAIDILQTALQGLTTLGQTDGPIYKQIYKLQESMR